MRRFLVAALWVVWIIVATMIVVVMRFIIDPIDPPSSAVAEFLVANFSPGKPLNDDVATLGWGLERVLPVHLMGYLAWRGFKAVFLR